MNQRELFHEPFAIGKPLILRAVCDIMRDNVYGERRGMRDCFKRARHNLATTHTRHSSPNVTAA